MQNKPNPGLVLTARDRALLEFIGTMGMATFAALHGRFWPGCQVATVRRRVQQLLHGGYVDWTWAVVGWYRTVTVIVLTDQGRKVFAPAARRYLRAGLPPATEQVQQVVAQEARVSLEQVITAQGGRVLHWIDGHELKSEINRQVQQARAWGTPLPDQVCADARMIVALADGREVAYEIEVDGQYYGKMLAGKLADLGRGGRPVLYICEPRRAARITQAAAAYPNIQVIGECSEVYVDGDD